MSGLDEFFYFVSQSVAFVGGVAIVSMVVTILAQICVGRVLILPGWGEELRLQDFIEYAGPGCVEGGIVRESCWSAF